MAEWQSAPAAAPGVWCVRVPVPDDGDLLIAVGGDDAQRWLTALVADPPKTTLGVLDRFSSGGIGSAPSFVVATARAGVVTAFIRGTLALRVEDAGGGTELVEAAHTRTWREVGFDGVVRASVGEAAELLAAGQGVGPQGGGAAASAHPATPLEAATPALVGRAQWQRDSAPLITPAAARPSGTTLAFDEAFPDDLFAGALLTAPTPVQAVPPVPWGSGTARPAEAAAGSDGVGDGPSDADTAPPEHTAPVTVSAVICPIGHANPPERSHCRVCETSLTGCRVTRVTRPSLGAAEVGGERIALAGTIVFGRSPRAERVEGGALPTLVCVGDGGSEISRNHLRVALEGWSVLVEDLGSTNGTTLRAADGSVRPLRPGEPAIVGDGDAAELGGTALVRFVGVP